MRVILVPSGVADLEAGANPHQYSTSYLLNDTVALDAGGIGFYDDPDRQSRVKNIIVTHSHIDHVASLPIFVENAYEGKSDCVTIHASQVVLDSLQRDIFNDRLWPDFIKMSPPDAKAPFLKLKTVEPGRSFELDGLRFTPVEVDHLVPTIGFLIEDGRSAILIVSDTGPTEDIWKVAARVPKLKAVFLEASFPDSMKWLAEASKHLTPSMFKTEANKLGKETKFIAVHIKARWREQIIDELGRLGMPDLEIGRFGVVYEF